MKKRWRTTWHQGKGGWLSGRASYRFRWRARNAAESMYSRGFYVQVRKER